jgi:2-methylisocitrate lyase-like PEP mutase family enzyme
VPLEEMMISKVKAAVDTRRDGDLQIVARTDARAILGLQAAFLRLSKVRCHSLSRKPMLACPR